MVFMQGTSEGLFERCQTPNNGGHLASIATIRVVTHRPSNEILSSHDDSSSAWSRLGLIQLSCRLCSSLGQRRFELEIPKRGPGEVALG
jgi:hypothetical protein